jgi:hypothetical protein
MSTLSVIVLGLLTTAIQPSPVASSFAKPPPPSTESSMWELSEPGAPDISSVNKSRRTKQNAAEKKRLISVFRQDTSPAMAPSDTQPGSPEVQSAPPNPARIPKGAIKKKPTTDPEAMESAPIPQPDQKPKQKNSFSPILGASASAGATLCAGYLLSTLPVALCALGLAVGLQGFEAAIAYSIGGLSSLCLGLTPGCVGFCSAGLGVWLGGGDITWYESLFPAVVTGLVGFAGGNATILATFLVGLIVAEVLGGFAVPFYFLVPLTIGLMTTIAMGAAAGLTSGGLLFYKSWMLPDEEVQAGIDMQQHPESPWEYQKRYVPTYAIGEDPRVGLGRPFPMAY